MWCPGSGVVLDCTDPDLCFLLTLKTGTRLPSPRGKTQNADNSTPARTQLTHFSRMEFPTVINWTSPFPFQGLSGGILHL